MIRKRYTLFAFLILFFTSQFSPAIAGPQDNLTKKLDDYILKAVEAGFSGAVLVVKGGEVILHEGYGLADREKNLPVKKDTVFDIGSIIRYGLNWRLNLNRLTWLKSKPYCLTWASSRLK